MGVRWANFQLKIKISIKICQKFLFFFFVLITFDPFSVLFWPVRPADLKSSAWPIPFPSLLYVYHSLARGMFSKKNWGGSVWGTVDTYQKYIMLKYYKQCFCNANFFCPDQKIKVFSVFIEILSMCLFVCTTMRTLLYQLSLECSCHLSTFIHT